MSRNHGIEITRNERRAVKMVNRKTIGILVGALTLVGLAAGTSLAEGLGAIAPEAAPSGEAITWHDGNREHTAWVRPDLVLELDPRGRESGYATTLREAAPGTSAASGVLESPVFEDVPGGGPIRALAGGLFVQLAVGTTEADADAFASAHGLKMRKLEYAETLYIVASDPGWASLDLANELRAENGVTAAWPNWWHEVHLR